MKHLFVIFVVVAMHGSTSAQQDRPAAMQPMLSSAPAQLNLDGGAGSRTTAKARSAVALADKGVFVKLTDEEMELAKRVHVEVIPCEMGSSVSVTAHEKEPGFFRVKTRTASFLMRPVSSRTGALRLEDARAEALWLQLSNKSMLMSQKLGQRLADECIGPEQAIVAEGLKKNPAHSIFDAALPEPTK